MIEIASYAFVGPILPGKTEAIRRVATEAMRQRRSEYEESRRRVGISRELVWLQQTPQGDMLIVY